MRVTTLTAVALAATTSLAFAVAPPSSTDAPDLETVPYAVEDPSGDANAANGQGFTEVDSTSTGPAQVATADILGGRVTSLFEGVEGDDGLLDYDVTGLEFRTALAADPTGDGAPVLFRFNVTAGGCTVFVQAFGGANPSPASFRLNGAGCGIDDPALSFETLSGDWITSAWDADAGELVIGVEFAGADPRVADLLPTEGFLQIDGLESRGNNVFVVAPTYDLTDSGFAEVGNDVPADQQPGDEPADTCSGTDGHAVTATNFDFDVTAISACSADTVTLTVDSGTHSLTVEGGEVDTGAFSSGSRTVELAGLADGTYEYFCSVHPSLMQGELTVTGGGGGAGAGSASDG